MEPHRIDHGFRWNAVVKYGLLPLLIVGLAVGLTASLQQWLSPVEANTAMFVDPPMFDGERAYGYLKKIVEYRTSHRRLRSQRTRTHAGRRPFYEGRRRGPGAAVQGCAPDDRANAHDGQPDCLMETRDSPSGCDWCPLRHTSARRRRSAARTAQPPLHRSQRPGFRHRCLDGNGSSSRRP